MHYSTISTFVLLSFFISFSCAILCYDDNYCGKDANGSWSCNNTAIVNCSGLQYCISYYSALGTSNDTRTWMNANWTRHYRGCASQNVINSLRQKATQWSMSCGFGGPMLGAALAYTTFEATSSTSTTTTTTTTPIPSTTTATPSPVTTSSPSTSTTTSIPLTTAATASITPQTTATAVPPLTTTSVAPSLAPTIPPTITTTATSTVTSTLATATTISTAPTTTTAITPTATVSLITTTVPATVVTSTVPTTLLASPSTSTSSPPTTPDLIPALLGAQPSGPVDVDNSTYVNNGSLITPSNSSLPLGDGNFTSSEWTNGNYSAMFNGTLQASTAPMTTAMGNLSVPQTATRSKRDASQQDDVPEIVGCVCQKDGCNGPDDTFTDEIRSYVEEQIARQNGGGLAFTFDE